MIHVIKTPPDEEPVTLAEMRAHLGITQATDTSRDSIITSRIISARQWAEHFTRTAFITQTWVGYGADFPLCSCLGLKAPLQSITGINYLDDSGIQQALDPSRYHIDTVSASIMPAWEQSWPTVRVQANSLQIVYVCGYGDAEAVPESIKEAIKFIVGQWEVFQSSIEGVMRPFTIPNAAKQLLDNYVDMRDWF